MGFYFWSWMVTGPAGRSVVSGCVAMATVFPVATSVTVSAGPEVRDSVSRVAVTVVRIVPPWNASPRSVSEVAPSGGSDGESKSRFDWYLHWELDDMPGARSRERGRTATHTHTHTHTGEKGEISDTMRRVTNRERRGGERVREKREERRENGGGDYYYYY